MDELIDIIIWLTETNRSHYEKINEVSRRNYIQICRSANDLQCY